MVAYRMGHNSQTVVLNRNDKMVGEIVMETNQSIESEVDDSKIDVYYKETQLQKHLPINNILYINIDQIIDYQLKYQTDDQFRLEVELNHKTYKSGFISLKQKRFNYKNEVQIRLDEQWLDYINKGSIVISLFRNDVGVGSVSVDMV